MLTKVSSLVTVVVAALTVTACQPDVSTVRSGAVYPSLPLNCPLELFTMPAMGMPAGLEMVGMVSLRADAGRNPNEPEMLAKIKPEACKLGGEKVSINSSMNVTNGITSASSLTYMVWRHAGPANAAPVTF